MYVHIFAAKSTTDSINFFRRSTRQLNLILDLYSKNFVDRNRVCAPTVELSQEICYADFLLFTFFLRRCQSVSCPGRKKNLRTQTTKLIYLFIDSGNKLFRLSTSLHQRAIRQGHSQSHGRSRCSLKPQSRKGAKKSLDYRVNPGDWLRLEAPTFGA
jgi:hypothetical protein